MPSSIETVIEQLEIIAKAMVEIDGAFDGLPDPHKRALEDSCLVHVDADSLRTIIAAINPTTPTPRPQVMPAYSGDFCASCGAPSMVRTGTCLTCQSCGSSSGGCS